MVAASRGFFRLDGRVAMTNPARLALLSLLATGSALAQVPPPASRPASAPAELQPPRPLTSTSVPYPAGAPSHRDPVVVRVKILVGADGRVQSVGLLSHTTPFFEQAVLRAVRNFRFTPARFGGQPVRVLIAFTHTFLPPLSPFKDASKGPPLVSVLRGRLVEMGTRVAVGGATVAALVDGRHYSTDADLKGRFRLPLPAGAARVTVHAPGYNAFLQQERLAPRQDLAVTYYVERERYDPYEIIVVSERRREEVSRIVLRGAEIKQIPGTFGDPFRVVQTLPGAASIVSLVPFPVVRGASPSSTGMLLGAVLPGRRAGHLRRLHGRDHRRPHAEGQAR